MHEDFRTAVFSANGLFWYGSSDATDLWQPVDAGYAFCLKSQVTIEHRKRRDIENNAERWFHNDETCTTAKKDVSQSRVGHEKFGKY